MLTNVRTPDFQTVESVCQQNNRQRVERWTAAASSSVRLTSALWPRLSTGTWVCVRNSAIQTKLPGNVSQRQEAHDNLAVASPSSLLRLLANELQQALLPVTNLRHPLVVRKRHTPCPLYVLLALWITSPLSVITCETVKVLESQTSSPDFPLLIIILQIDLRPLQAPVTGCWALSFPP
jgi:hypothetical protein